MSSLTKDDLAVLRKPFAANDHEFLSGNAYITESAITTRIEDVDPAWSFVIVNEWTRDNQCIALGRMTVKGVSRDGVGMQPLTIQKRDGTKVEATDPEKSAATDALKRCARLFGVGRYLLDLPRDISDTASLARYLGKSPAPAQPKAAPPKPPNVTDIKDAPKPAPANGETWTYDYQALMKDKRVQAAIEQPNHRASAIQLLKDAGWFDGCANLDEAVAVVVERPDKQQPKAS